jgi:hypothetical protein
LILGISGWPDKLPGICEHDAGWDRLEDVVPPLLQRALQQLEHQAHEGGLASRTRECEGNGIEEGVLGFRV